MDIKESRKIKIITENPNELPITYANAINVSSSYMDFQLILGCQFLDAGNNEILIKETERIMISPQQAKMLLSVLREQLKTYEEKFGPISPLTDVIEY